MIRAMERLMKSKKNNEAGSDQISGFLTKNDIKKLRSSRTLVSVHRKKTIRTWNCTDCKQSFYYEVMRCPHCESANIEEKIIPTQYEYAATEADIRELMEAEQEVIP